MITDKEASERKKRIKDTAFTLFSEHGADKVTYEDISKVSGISVASIYHYYPKKSYLLFETYEHLWLDIITELREATFENESFNLLSGYKQVQQLIDAYEELFEKSGDYLKFALECKLYWNRHSQTIPSEKYWGITSPIVDLFARAVRKGVEDSSISLQADFESSCFLIWGILRTYIEQIVMLDGFIGGTNHLKTHFKTMKRLMLKFLG